MRDLLRRVFGGAKAEPIPHHVVLAKEAERTGDDTRLTAEIIVKWSWDHLNEAPNVASAAEFVENCADNGHKPESNLSPEEKAALSPAQLLICRALDGIQKDGQLDGRMGHILREFSETGVLEKSAVATLALKPM